MASALRGLAFEAPEQFRQLETDARQKWVACLSCKKIFERVVVNKNRKNHPGVADQKKCWSKNE